MSIEFTTSLFGRRDVKYACPNCKEVLRSPLSDAGQRDSCPNCHVQFLVPGKRRLQREIKEKNEAAEREKGNAAAKLEAKELEEHLAAVKKRGAEESSELAEQQREQTGPPPLPAANGHPAQSTITKLGGPFAILAILTLAILALVIPTVAIVSSIYSGSTESGAGVTKSRAGVTKSGADVIDLVQSAGIRTKLKSCESYGIVNADAYYDGIVSTDVVVFDLLDGGAGSARRIDSLHLFMQFADKLNLYKVRKVVLARNGSKKFNISSSELRRLSDSYAGGGRIAAFNNLPAAVETMSGRSPYGKWTGGVLGVLQKQTEDLNDFIQSWTGY